MFDYAKKIREYRERKCLRSANFSCVLLGFRASRRGVVEKKINCYYVKCSLTKSIS